MYPVIKPCLGIKEMFAFFWYVRNPLQKFEKNFAKKIGKKYAVAFPYGRSALYAALKALEIKNKEIITPAYTCIVAQNAVAFSGNKNVFVDINLDDFNMKLNEIKKKVNKKTKAVIATHMYGYPMELKKLRKILGKKVLIIEDACLALKAKNVGLSDMQFYSFNQSKQMTTFDGGMITTDNKEFYEKIKQFRDRNFKKPSLMKRIKKCYELKFSYFLYNRAIYGIMNSIYDLLNLKRVVSYENWDLKKPTMPFDWKEQMTRLQAKIGLLQLKKLDRIIKKRIKLAKIYDKHLKAKGIIKPKIMEGATYSHYTIMRRDRNKLRKLLKKQGINTGEAMNYSVPETTAFKTKEKFPNAEIAARTIINLPFYPGLNERDVRKICKKIKSITSS